jgi:hypothetical protein
MLSPAFRNYTTKNGYTSITQLALPAECLPTAAFETFIYVFRDPISGGTKMIAA